MIITYEDVEAVYDEYERRMQMDKYDKYERLSYMQGIYGTLMALADNWIDVVNYIDVIEVNRKVWE